MLTAPVPLAANAHRVKQPPRGALARTAITQQLGIYRLLGILRHGGEWTRDAPHKPSNAAREVTKKPQPH